MSQKFKIRAKRNKFWVQFAVRKLRKPVFSIVDTGLCVYKLSNFEMTMFSFTLTGLLMCATKATGAKKTASSTLSAQVGSIEFIAMYVVVPIEWPI